MNTLIVTATRNKIQDVYLTPLIKSALKETNISWTKMECTLENTQAYIQFYNKNVVKFENTDVIVFAENKQGLAAVYNFVLDHWARMKLAGNYDAIIFIHDDVTIKCPEMLEQLKASFEKGNSVLGLAGASKVQIKEPALWHIMSPREAWSGRVWHPYYVKEEGHDKVFLSDFGPVPQRCIVIDCLFIAIKVQDILDKGVRFDSQFDFHCVDLDFSLTCNKKQLKISTVPVDVIHNSPGLNDINDPCFQRNQKLFIQKWKPTSS